MIWVWAVKERMESRGSLTSVMDCHAWIWGNIEGQTDAQNKVDRVPFAMRCKLPKK